MGKGVQLCNDNDKQKSGHGLHKGPRIVHNP